MKKLSAGTLCLFASSTPACNGDVDICSENGTNVLAYSCVDGRDRFGEAQVAIPLARLRTEARPGGRWWFSSTSELVPPGFEAVLTLSASEPPAVVLDGERPATDWVQIGGQPFFFVVVPAAAQAGDTFELEWQGRCGSDPCRITQTLSVVDRTGFRVIQATGEAKPAACVASCFDENASDQIVHSVRFEVEGAPALERMPEGLRFVFGDVGGPQYLDVESSTSAVSLQAGSVRVELLSLDTMEKVFETDVQLPQAVAPLLVTERSSGLICGELTPYCRSRQD